MALAMAVVIALITLISVYIFGAKVWWMPPSISTHGPAVDHQFNLTLIVTGVVFVLAQLGLAYFVWKYRERGDGRKATYSHGNNALEVGWTSAAAIVFIGLNLIGYRIWANMYFTPAAPGALDGKFGPTHVEKIDDATGNFYGLDREHDPDSKDDVVTATLGVPVNRPIELVLRSKDVGHSFYVRELRLHQDILPGIEIPIHFTTTEDALKYNGGKYEIVCTQLCGLGHYKMRAFLQVMTEADFEKWLQGQAGAQ